MARACTGVRHMAIVQQHTLEMSPTAPSAGGFCNRESEVNLAIFYIQHLSVKGNIVLFLTKMYIYFRMLCIPGNN